jgi:hypothetical protein
MGGVLGAMTLTVARTDVARRQCRGKATRPLVEAGVADARAAVDDRGLVRPDAGNAGKLRQRGQRRVVGRHALQAVFVFLGGRGTFPAGHATRLAFRPAPASTVRAG